MSIITKKLFYYILLSIGFIFILGIELAFMPVLAIPTVLIVILWAVYGYFKKKKSIGKQIPEDVLKDLQDAESLYEKEVNENGTADPQAILWKIAKSKSKFRDGITIRHSKQENPATGSRVVLDIPSGRKDIQDNTTSESGSYQVINKGVTRNNPKRFLFRRRK